jgi:FkbM family methyltransferase
MTTPAAPAIVDGLFEMLIETAPLHARSSAVHRYVAQQVGEKLRASPLREGADGAIDFGPFGALTFPYRRMGAIDSLDLFGLDELILFAFYHANRGRYQKAADIGANLGLHSIVLARCGVSVRAFEPDPIHADLLRANLERNGVSTVELVQAAVSDRDGKTEFVRVKGNTTGSNLAGAKAAPYGELDRFPVRIEAAMRALDGCDFAKIDAEGHEPVILGAIPFDRWASLDAMVEIGAPENAHLVYNHFAGSGIGLFPQKLGWMRAERFDDLPTSHREGSLFITTKNSTPWT